ncbi:hypothetical protein F1847_08525 [Thermodesulfobacterium sp. TA1]|uniref:peptidylprolyl isomerase n=1 Tax=Thermodesulfobacterium sp. TA1 TaxID=2234087 RepID=UPI0012324367|nr:peptidylprolyl isomerase [Thermodesulfobacterium sp. TA1]QER42788.1 hypothetical protein F1847_08525 [Thermodesulfobacterium sp. TA1]
MKKCLLLCVLVLMFVWGRQIGYGAEAKVLAEVGPYKLYEEEVEKVLNQDPQVQELIKSSPGAKEQIKKTLVERWITLSLLGLAAKDEGLDKTPEVQRELANIEKQVLAQKYLKAKLAGIKVSEEELKSYYEKNKERYVEPEAVELKHILVYLSPKAKKEEEEKALKKANQIRAQLLKGAKFEDLAKAYSDDTQSKNQGGSLGIIKKGETDPQFEAKIFSLNPGEISQPIRSNYGYHLIKVVKKIPAKTLTFEEAKPLVERDLIEEKEEVLMKDLIQKLSQKYTPKIY